MLIGYARVSAAGKDGLELQREALDRAGIDRLFIDVASGGKAKHPQLERALAQLRAGDTLVLWKLDRLGRSARRLIETVEDLSRRGIGFRSLMEDIDRMGGRRPKLDERQRAQAVTLHKDSSNPVDDICQTLRIGRATLYRYLSEKSRRKAGRKPKARTGAP